MKQLLRRCSALLLAALLLVSAVPIVGAGAERPDPSCTLGTYSGDMLIGGTQVQTDDGLFYIGDDGYIYNTRSTRPVYAKPAARLNYADGVLYFARLHEDGFDLVSFAPATGKETVYLENFSGSPRQVYLVNGSRLDFLCDNAVWSLHLDDGSFRLIRFAQNLWSFVPTGCGLIYAVGTVFDYTLYAEDYLIAEHVQSYYVDFDLGGGALVYSQDGMDCQIDLVSAFVGMAEPVAFQGAAPVNVSDDGTDPSTLTEAERLSREADSAAEIDETIQEILNQPENQPPKLDPPVENEVPAQPEISPEDLENDPQAVNPEAPTEPAETEPAETPTEPAETEPAETPTEPAETEPAETPTEPAETEPAETPIEPAETEPAETPTEPAETEPAETPTEPAETEPAETPTEPAETEPAETPTEPAETEPAETPTEPAATQPAETPATPVQPIPGINVPAVDAVYPVTATDDTDDQIRMPLTQGQENIVKRAMQMVNIRWTPRKDIYGWNKNYTYKAGVTYTGLPYGQAVNAAYVPWKASLSEFIDAVNNPDSLMYTSYSSYNKRAPYYSVDCSAFASWALQLPRRQSTSGMPNFGNLISSSSYAGIQVGDYLNVHNPSGSQHVVLITDVTYDADGAITGIEISQATPTPSYYGVCRSTWFRGSSGLASFRNAYFGGGYKLYRSKTRESVHYEHTCVVPLEGDECALCGAGMLLKPGVDVSQWQGAIDWQTLAPHISFAILRVGYRGSDGKLYVDKQFAANVAGCDANDIPYGVYFYSGAKTEAEAAAEAEFVLTSLNGHYPSLPVFLDVEDTKTILSLNASSLLPVVRSFCDYMGNFFPVGVYASESVWNSKMTDPAYNDWCRWVAKWNTTVDTSSGGNVTLSANGGANVWQYGTNYMPGIGKNASGEQISVDMDYWFGKVGGMEHRYRSEIKSATCTRAGTLTYTCVECGQRLEKELLALGHHFEDDVCIRCGKQKTPFDQFTDIFPNKWYSEAVCYVIQHGLCNGLKSTQFAPFVELNRAMMVTVLWRHAGSPETTPEALFTDVPTDRYYSQAITWAAHNGITNGVSATGFSPNRDITREQVAALFYRYAMYLGADTSTRADLSTFPDAGAVHGYAQDAMSWAVAAGIIKGSKTENGPILKPTAECTRAEMCVMLYRFICNVAPEA